MSDDNLPDAIRIRVAGREDMPAVYRLAHDVYAAEGYCDPQPGGELRHHESLDRIPETTVFVLEIGDRLAGSVTVTMDSPSGLHTDHAFRVETDHERSDCRVLGLMLAASSRIITSPDCRSHPAVVRALILRVFIHLEMMRADRLLCTFNPKHRRAWERILGMRTIAGPRPDPSVNGAPAVLMRGVVSESQARLSEMHRVMKGP